jgi:hypothetical protein
MLRPFYPLKAYRQLFLLRQLEMLQTTLMWNDAVIMDNWLGNKWKEAVELWDTEENHVTY